MCGISRAKQLQINTHILSGKTTANGAPFASNLRETDNAKPTRRIPRKGLINK